MSEPGLDPSVAIAIAFLLFIMAVIMAAAFNEPEDDGDRRSSLDM